MGSWAVVVAGGSGARFGGPKQFADLAGRPVVHWALEAARGACDGVVLVVPPDRAAEAWPADLVACGGPSRSASVRSGLALVPSAAEVIVVHDAARPLARASLWRAVVAEVTGSVDGAVPAVAVADTLKKVGPDGSLSTVDRSGLFAVQTPQAFRADALKAAHARGGEATDDAALVEAAGGRVVLVPGAPDNIKITSPDDLRIAAALVEARR
ncbi:MAG TPA: 2-C-methyl-D-erythritol 4-phosphate cytidylyltransferase [Acidimicrobiales bacterium]|nr:2-C-methyl-D-erythritol 4-phosphate cytidylyltransferase [Acidimicrobiales bacterium]